jgi:hypothetical protein
MPVIPAIQEAEIRRITVQSQLRQIVHETLPQKTYHKKWLVEWLKVWALSSNPSTAKKKKENCRISDPYPRPMKREFAAGNSL